MGEQANGFSQPELSQEQGACLGRVLGQCARDDSKPQGKLVSPGEVLQQGFWGREEVLPLSLGSFGQAQGVACVVPSPFLPGWCSQGRAWQLWEERMTWNCSLPLLHPPESPPVNPGCVTSTGTTLPALLALCLSEASPGAIDNNW